MIVVAQLGLRIITNYSGGNDRVKIVFLDVGQGDAILIQYQDSWFDAVQVLIDGGPDRSVLAGLGDYMPLFDRKIETVIATHPDTDHIGGLVEVLRRYDVGSVIHNGQNAESPAYKNFVLEAGSAEVIATDDQVSLVRVGEETSVMFIPVPNNYADRNDNSVITRIDHGSFSVLLTGDASVEVEQYLIENYGPVIDVDVLKLGHHGSRTSTSMKFLQATTPQQVVISAPVNGRYGHPHDEVIDNVVTYGRAKIFYTGEQGTIEFSPNQLGRGYQIVQQKTPN